MDEQNAPCFTLEYSCASLLYFVWRSVTLAIVVGRVHGVTSENRDAINAVSSGVDGPVLAERWRLTPVSFEPDSSGRLAHRYRLTSVLPGGLFRYFGKLNSKT